mmetsp:Transcript_57605/g.123896  ORF Transcript_57605/g.123896 Transcript_57605/m.123896 type:complete len:248 (-) Transcript_57605:721-1464(-)
MRFELHLAPHGPAEGRLHTVTPERKAAAEAEVEHDTESEDVYLEVVALASEDLRGGVARAAAFPGHLLQVQVMRSDAEVSQDKTTAVPQEHVVGLDVAMNDTARLQMLESLQDALHHLTTALLCERGPHDLVKEIPAAAALHHETQAPVGLRRSGVDGRLHPHEAEHAYHVGMTLDRRQCGDLPLQAQLLFAWLLLRDLHHDLSGRALPKDLPDVGTVHHSTRALAQGLRFHLTRGSGIRKNGPSGA